MTGDDLADQVADVAAGWIAGGINSEQLAAMIGERIAAALHGFAARAYGSVFHRVEMAISYAAAKAVSDNNDGIAGRSPRR